MSTSTFTPKPIHVNIAGTNYDLIAFYYAGKILKGDVDDLCQAYYLGNFFEFDDNHKIQLDIKGIKASFYNSEAAFQSTKWWSNPAIRNAFEQEKSGDAAFALSKSQGHATDNYAGLGQEGAMYEVLLQKFSNPDLQQGLLATGNAYLLEHNPKKGRDKGQYWSDDYDGAGANMLGKTIMRVREHYGGMPAPCTTCAVKDFSSAINHALAKVVALPKTVVAGTGYITVIPSVFEDNGQPGDFLWMLGKPEYADAFFIFNDNSLQFQAHHNDPADPKGCRAGGGNAIIRPWQCKTPPRAGGIPTGPDFESLADAKSLIDLAITDIKNVLVNNNFKRVFFSSDGHGGLGTSIFEVPHDVKEYIVQEINNLG